MKIPLKLRSTTDFMSQNCFEFCLFKIPNFGMNIALQQNTNLKSIFQCFQATVGSNTNLWLHKAWAWDCRPKIWSSPYLCSARHHSVKSNSFVDIISFFLRFSLCDFPLHLPLELLGVDLALQVWPRVSLIKCKWDHLSLSCLTNRLFVGVDLNFVGEESDPPLPWYECPLPVSPCTDQPDLSSSVHVSCNSHSTHLYVRVRTTPPGPYTLCYWASCFISEAKQTTYVSQCLKWKR